MSSTSSPPGTQAGHSPNEPPDRGGTPGTFVADGQGGETEASSNAGDAWQQVPFTPVRLGARRPREMAETPVLAPASKQVRFADAEDDATEPDDGGISSASVEQDGVGARPTRTAALQASKALTREAQAIAVGLTPSRSGQGSLGSALGIGRANADNIVTAESGGIDEAAASSSSSSAPAAAAEAGNLTEGAAAGGAGEELRGLIAALEFRQRQRAEDTTQLCRSVDAAVSSGAVSKSGGELLMLALRLALAQGEQGPHAPEVAPALIECLRKYDVSKPQHFQRPDLTRTVRREPASATPAAASKAPPAPRRWEHLSKMRTLGGGNGSAQAMAEKGGYKPSTMAFSLATDSSASTLLPHQRMQLVNEALSKAGAPETVRMAASELTGGGETLKIKPGPKCSFDELHAHREVIREALGAVEVRDAKQWTRCKVLYVPKRQGELDLSADIVRKDIEASIGVKLVRDPHRLHRGEADARREWDHMQFAVLEEDMKRRPRTEGALRSLPRIPPPLRRGLHKQGPLQALRIGRTRDGGSQVQALRVARCALVPCALPQLRGATRVRRSGLPPHAQDEQAHALLAGPGHGTGARGAQPGSPGLPEGSCGSGGAAQKGGGLQHAGGGYCGARRQGGRHGWRGLFRGLLRLQLMRPEGRSGAGDATVAQQATTLTSRGRRSGVKHRKKWSQGLLVLQANVGKGERSTEAALRTAEQVGADVVMLQEPRIWRSEASQEWVPRSCPAYEAILPETRGSTSLPRVLTYVRRNHPSLTFAPMQQLLSAQNPDVLVVDVLGARGGPLRLVNVYSAPQGVACVRPGHGIRGISTARLDSGRTATFLAGDFNAHHRAWSGPAALTKRSSAGVKLGSIMRTEGWQLGLPAGSITRRGAAGEADSAIDLTFLSKAFQTSGWTSTCAVRKDLATGSDHFPILTELRPPQPLEASQKDRPLNFKRTDWDKFASLVSKRSGPLRQLVEAADTAAERGRHDLCAALDEAFWHLQELLQGALAETTPRCKGITGGQPFWDADCDEALGALRVAELDLAQARAEGFSDTKAREEAKAAGRRFGRQVSRSKRTFYDDRLNKLSGNQAFGAMKWSGGASRRHRAPPLVGPDGLVRVKGEEKMALLRELLLAPPPPANVPMPNLERPHVTTIADSALRIDELRAAVFGQAQDKAAGPDGIPFRALRVVWARLEGQLFSLFGHALAAGWHPRPFRQATLVALQKQGKRDPSNPRSYRLIALLPTLGKILEKVVAVRLVRFGLEYGIISGEQFGSIPGRSTTDAALTLVHDIEVGWTHAPPLITSALAADVRGAYDSVHGTRLVKRLYEQGLPLQLCRWVLAFVSERSAGMRLDDNTSPLAPVSAGIPQGSPVSPILYVLFVAPLHRLFGPAAPDDDLKPVRLISYVDDNLLYTASSSASINARRLRKAYDVMWLWARDNGMIFDADKKDFIEFTSPRCKREVAGQIVLRDGTVEAVADKSSFRWLGIHFDPRLNFHDHVQAACASAQKAVGAMTMLMNTVKGMRVHDARRLYVACVRSKLVYAAPVWWRGRTRVEPGRPHVIRRRGDDGRRRVPPPDPPTTKSNDEAARHVKQLDSAQHAGLLRALPAFRTSSKISLQVEAACPPMDLVLDNCLDRAALRLAKLDMDHPLRLRTKALITFAPPKFPEYVTPSSRLSRATPEPLSMDSSRPAASRPFSTRLTALAARVPLRLETPASVFGVLRDIRLEDNPRVHIEGVDEWRESALRANWSSPPVRDKHGLQVFTDGSQQVVGGQRRTGAGWVICLDGQILERGRTATGHRMEVFDAEAVALMLGTVRGLTLLNQLSARSVSVFADNQAVLHSLRSARASSSMEAFAYITTFAHRFLQFNRDFRLAFRWVKGHVGVDGNEAADTEAGLAAASPYVVDESEHPVSFAAAMRQGRERLQEQWRDRWWKERTNARRLGKASVYQQTRTAPPSIRPSPLLQELSRRQFGLLLHLRTGHGDFSEYHDRFKHEEALRTCLCGASFQRLHPLICPAYAQHQHLLMGEDGHQLEARDLLGDDAGARKLMEYARTSKAFAANRTKAVLEARSRST